MPCSEPALSIADILRDQVGDLHQARLAAQPQRLERLTERLEALESAGE